MLKRVYKMNTDHLNENENSFLRYLAGLGLSLERKVLIL